MSELPNLPTCSTPTAELIAELGYWPIVVSMTDQPGVFRAVGRRVAGIQVQVTSKWGRWLVGREIVDHSRVTCRWIYRWINGDDAIELAGYDSWYNARSLKLEA